jgi:diguanylate cyclase (GGDEF)-like protein/PAS domain S-box-containing protein
MESQLPATSARRRSDRVSIAFAVEVDGIDLAGNRFSERTKTTTVSRYGCAFPLPRMLKPEQTLQLRRIGTNETVAGRVVAPMGAQAEGRLYGIGTMESCEGLWGIRFSSSFYEKLLDNMHDGVYFVNRERKITYWNDGAQRLSGYAAGEAVGKSCPDNFLGHVDESGKPLCSNGCPLRSVLVDGQPREVEIYLRHKEGYRIPVRVRALPMRDSAGDIVGAVEVFSDSTATKKVEKRVGELEQLAFRDALTGLPNRRYLQLKVEQALEEHRRFARPYGLLMFDVDRFKQVNDTHGHDVGDGLLKTVSKTLVQGLRTVDIVGRWGGEEFLVLMPDLDAVGLGDLAERCRVLIAQSSVAANGSRLSVTASIGATVLGHSDSADSAIRRADALMYESKHCGGDRTTAG